jgi:predicted Fe-S protein YdhL (DUF1289 family)
MKHTLSFDKRIKQRFKGTHDSPCLSVCTHKQGDIICKACGMTRSEKKGWKRHTPQEKAVIRDQAAYRHQQCAYSAV